MHVPARQGSSSLPPVVPVGDPPGLRGVGADQVLALLLSWPGRSLSRCRAARSSRGNGLSPGWQA